MPNSLPVVVPAVAERPRVWLPENNCAEAVTPLNQNQNGNLSLAETGCSRGDLEAEEFWIEVEALEVGGARSRNYEYRIWLPNEAL